MESATACRGTLGRSHPRLLATPYLWAGMAAYALALAMYLILLSRVPLNVATSFAASLRRLLLASLIVLGEPIPPLRYVVFGLIVAASSSWAARKPDAMNRVQGDGTALGRMPPARRLLPCRW